MRRMVVAAVVSMMALTGPVAAEGNAEAEAQVLALVNAQRVAKGCKALAINSQLQAAAHGHARAMAEHNFFSHTGKNGSNLKGRVRAAGYKGGRLAENIANGQKTASAVVSAWLGSRSHLKNILNCAYKDTGIALVYQADDAPLPGKSYIPRYYWVQTFGQQ